MHFRAAYHLGFPCRGTFAIVRKAVSKHDGSTWAVKCIDKSRLEKDEEAALRLEVAILESVDHPAIVHMRQVHDTPKVSGEMDYANIFLEVLNTPRTQN